MNNQKKEWIAPKLTILDINSDTTLNTGIFQNFIILNGVTG
jgi:hypothetical protein